MKKRPKLKKYPLGTITGPVTEPVAKGKVISTPYNQAFDYDNYNKALATNKNIPMDKNTGMINTPENLRGYMPSLTGNIRFQQGAMDAYMQENKLTELTPEQGTMALSKAGYGDYNGYLKNADAYKNYRDKTIVPGKNLDQSVDISGTAVNAGQGGGYTMTPTTPYDSTHAEYMFPKNTVTNIQKHSYGGRQLPKFYPGGRTTMGPVEDDQNAAGYDETYNPADPNRDMPDSNNNQTSGSQYIAGAGALATGGANMYQTYNNPTATNRAKSDSFDQTARGVTSAISPVIGGIIGIGDTIGKPIRAKAEATDANGNVINKNKAKAGAIAGMFFDPGKWIGQLASGNFDASGDKYIEGIEADAKANIASQKQEQDYNNQQAQYLSNSEYEFIPYSKNKYETGGMYQGPKNAEIELKEVVQHTDGSTEQADGVAHAFGGVPVNLENGARIFSDRLKNPETKLTFAKEAAKFKIKEVKDRALTATEQLVNSVRQKKLDMIFQAQESLKAAKVQAYAKKMGVELPGQHQMHDGSMMPDSEMRYGGKMCYPDGGIKQQFSNIAPYNKSGIPLNNQQDSINYAHGYNVGSPIIESYANTDLGSDAINAGAIQRIMEQSNTSKYPTISNNEVLRLAKEGKRSDLLLLNPIDRARVDKASGRDYYKKFGFANGGTKLPKYDGGGTWVEGVWVPDNSAATGYGYSTPQGTFNSAGRQTSDSYGRPLGFDEPLPMITNEDLEDRNQLALKTQQNSQIPTTINQVGKTVTKSSEEKDYSNYRDVAGLAGNALLQNSGNIWDLYQTRMGKKWDKENSGQLTSQKLDSTQALMDADIQNRITRGALAGAAGGSAGTFMNNAIQAGAQNTLNKGRVRANYDAKNIVLANQDLYHNQATRMLDKSNEQQNKARSEDIARQAVRGLGTNTSAAYKDYKAGKMDKNTASMISSMFTNYKLDMNNPNHWNWVFEQAKKG